MTAPPGRLFGPGARAVLIGTAAHRAGSLLQPLPAVESTLDDVETALRELCGLAADAIHRLPPYATAPDVVALVERLAAEAEGVLLLYYVGHGILGPGNDLHLATWSSESDESIGHAVPYAVLRDLLGTARHGSLVVLDCCYSGRAAAPEGGPGDPAVHARPQGSALLSSASRYELAFAPPGLPHTRFSGRLLTLLAEGDPSGPPDLTLDSLYRALAGLPWDGGAGPRLQSDGALVSAVLTRNRAYPERPEWRPLPPAPAPCPYPGMGAFKAAEAAYFFGRERFTELLLAEVGTPGRQDAVLVVGSSGVGKSSLLRAGLLAALGERRAERPEAVPWPALLLPVPGEHPLHLLAERWAQATGRAPDDVLRALWAGEFPPARPGHRAPRLLLVDQLEEVFTRCEDKAEREHFLSLLGPARPAPSGPPAGPAPFTSPAAPASPDSPAPPLPPERPLAVLAVQADHYGLLTDHPTLYAAVERGVVNLPPLTPAELREAIELPAARTGLGLEHGLTDRLLHDLRHGRQDRPSSPGAALPFLAHALHATWLHRSGHVLTLAGYESTGGIWQSVSNSAQRLHDELDERRRGVLRDILLRMVHIGPQDAAVRRRAGLAELLDGHSTAEQQVISEVLDRLTHTRLVVRGGGFVEISHEALLRAWDRLDQWLRESREELLARQRLSGLVARWVESRRQDSYLVGGDQLAALRGRTGPARSAPAARITLTTVELDFLRACTRRERRQRRRRRSAAVVAVSLVLALTGALVVARIQRGVADERAAEVRSKRIAAVADALRPDDPAAALEMSLAAFRTAPTVEARSALLRSALTPVPAVLEGHTQTVLNLAFQPGGATLASSSADRTVRTWDVSDPVHPHPRQTLAVDGKATIAWRPDGRHLFAQAGRQLYVWDVSDPDHAREVARVTAADSGLAHGSAISPDGRLLAVATDRGLVLWDVTDPGRPAGGLVPGPDGGAPLDCVAFHPDGRTLAAGLSDGDLRLWKVPDRHGAAPGALITDAFALSVAISPDGRTLAAGGADDVKAWNITDPEHPEKALGPFSLPAATPALSFRGDGHYLAGAGWDGHVRVFSVGPDDSDLGSPDELPSEDRGAASPRPDLATLKPGDEPPLPPHAVQAVAYRPDNRGLAAGRSDGGIRLWSPLRRSVPDTAAQRGVVSGSMLSADGAYYVGTDVSSGTARIWLIRDPDKAPSLAATLPEPWSRARFLPGREALISQDRGGTRLKLWGFAGGVLTPGQEFEQAAGEDAGSAGFALAPDGNRLLLHRAAVGEAALWNIERLDRAEQEGTIPGAGPQAVPSFTGPRSAALLLPRQAQFWDFADPRHPVRTAVVDEPPQSLYRTAGDWLLVTAPLLQTDPGRQTIGEPLIRLWSPGGPDGARALGTTTADGQVSALLGDHLLAVVSERGRPVLMRLPELRPVVLQGGLTALSGLEAVPKTGRLVGWKTADGGGLAVWRAPSASEEGGAGAELLASAERLKDYARIDLRRLSVLAVGPTDGAMLLDFDSDLLRALDVGVLLVPTGLDDELPKALCAALPGRMGEAKWRELLPGTDYAEPCPPAS
ncbi:hypothetical protein [Kitasatospora sp. NPDC047058]|uniref:caspase, EACC1-associated type n=1 Tax=Kitasatospora sp. NPDC047058 TaxID=3155620 RepID=UPI0033EAFC3B